MEVLLPPCAGGLDIFGAVSERGRQVLVDPHAVRLEVPVPHDVVRRAPDEQETLLAPAQAFLRPSALRDIEGDANRPEDPAVA